MVSVHSDIKPHNILEIMVSVHSDIKPYNILEIMVSVHSDIKPLNIHVMVVSVDVLEASTRDMVAKINEIQMYEEYDPDQIRRSLRELKQPYVASIYSDLSVQSNRSRVSVLSEQLEEARANVAAKMTRVQETEAEAEDQRLIREAEAKARAELEEMHQSVANRKAKRELEAEMCKRKELEAAMDEEAEGLRASYLEPSSEAPPQYHTSNPPQRRLSILNQEMLAWPWHSPTSWTAAGSPSPRPSSSPASLMSLTSSAAASRHWWQTRASPLKR
jgi:hypothetical protein